MSDTRKRDHALFVAQKSVQLQAFPKLCEELATCALKVLQTIEHKVIREATRMELQDLLETEDVRRAA